MIYSLLDNKCFNSIMKVLILLSLIVFASAFREFRNFETENTNPEFDKDAEANDPASESPFLWNGTFFPESETAGDNSGVYVNSNRPTILEILIGRPMHNPFLFPWRPMVPMRDLFPQRPLFDFGFDDEYDDSNKTSDDFFPGDFLPDFFGTPFVDPNLKDLPPNYENSTFEVKDINGTKFHVNRTIEKKSGDGYNSFFHTQVVKVVPQNSTLEERPLEKIPEETTPRKEIEPEFEIPQIYDDSINQLDYKKPSAARAENIEVRRGERSRRSPLSSQSPNKVNTFPDDINNSHHEGSDFFPRSTNLRRHFVLGKKDSRSNLEKIYRRNFVFKNMYGTNYAYNLLNRLNDLEDSLTPETFEGQDLAIDIPDNEPFRPYSRHAPQYEDGQNYISRIPFRTNYVYGPIVPNMRINPPTYQTFPKEMNYETTIFNDFVNEPTSPTERENESNRNVLVETLKPAPQRKKVRLIEAISVPKSLVRSSSSRNNNGKPVASKYILVPVNHREVVKPASSYYKQSGERSKGSRYGENDVETILVIRPPDLSRDTRVNSIAAERSDSQQGLVQVDPDVEVFDLSLVLKELETHD